MGFGYLWLLILVFLIGWLFDLLTVRVCLYFIKQCLKMTFPYFSILNGQFFMISFFQIVPIIPKLVCVHWLLDYWCFGCIVLFGSECMLYCFSVRSKDDGSLHYWDRYVWLTSSQVFANSLAGLIKPILSFLRIWFCPFLFSIWIVLLIFQICNWYLLQQDWPLH